MFILSLIMNIGHFNGFLFISNRKKRKMFFGDK